MKTLKLLSYLLLAALTPRFVLADLVGPYTADANTLFLLHFDEAAGGTVTTNLGSKAANFYSVTEATASATPATVTTMLGAAGYVNGPTNFNNCMTNPATGYLFGFDANKSLAYQGEGSAPCPDAIAMTNLNIGNGGQTPFTIEALIRPTTITAAINQEIICTDSSASGRAFQFRITTAGALNFQFINGTGLAISGNIPTSGADAFVAGNWYHVAMTYNGSTATLYWTKLDPANGAAHVLSTASMALGTTQGATTGPLCIGNENRAAAGEQFLGSIDEVRISSVARAANQMQFYSPLVTITQNPVSQNVDYNQPVNLSVGASSLTSLGYQWRFNSNSLAGYTNSAFTITNVAASNAGYYDCVVTNTAGYTATSSPALLVVGAANFLADRYSFTADTSDSIGGNTGTNFGNATVSGGKLVLDGTSGTYMQLPPGLFNATNATALTVEFWATYGTNPNNVYAFAFGVTNFVFSQGIVGFNYAMYSPHNASGQTASSSPGDPLFAQSVSTSGNLDGRTVHVAVVFDPPNKMLSIYTNGVLEAANTNFTVNISSLNDQMSFIGRSLWAADPYLNASIDEIRIFKGALSPITIKQSDDQGPDTLLADGPANFVLQPADASIPAGQSVTFTAAAVGYLPITYQWFKNGSPISGATNASYSFVTALGDNAATFNVQATNTIGVTTYVTSSTTATLTVFVPPTLAWLDAVNGGADNSWNTTSFNWTNNVNSIVAFAQTNGVVFDNRGSGSPTVDIPQSVIPYNITVNASSDYLLTSSSTVGSLEGQGSLTKLGSATLTLDVSNNLSGPLLIAAGKVQIGNFDGYGSLGNGAVTNNAALAFARGDTTLVVPNAIHGSGTVSVDGGGTVTFTGNSDYAGGTFLNSGIAIQQSSSAFGATSSGTTIASGGQLYITANVNSAEALVLNGAGGDANGALRKGGAGVTTNTGAITLASDSTIGIDGGSTLVLGNVVSGSGILSAIGGGALTLNANNAFNGFALNGATINVNANRALGTGLVTINGAGHFIFADGLTVTNPFLATVITPGTSTGLLMVNDNTNGTITTLGGWLEFDATPTSGSDFIGPISSGYLQVTGPVTNTATGVVGSRNGRVRFSGGGNYTTFNLNEGTVSIGANDGLCPSATLVMGVSFPATFDLNGFNQALAGLSDGAAFAELITNSSAALSTLTLNLVGGGTYSGVIAGKVALVQNGFGSLYLAGTNNYTGNTTVNGGTLELAQPSLFANSTVNVASGATLQLDFATTNQVAGLVLGGVTQPLGVYNNTTSPSFITGAGSLLVAQSVATNPTNITTVVNGNTLELAWPADHTGWTLQVQTNTLSAGLGTNWVDVPGSASVRSVTNTINPAHGSVFYRLHYP